MSRAARPVKIIMCQPYSNRLAEYHLHRDGTVYERKQNGNTKRETNEFVIAAVHAKARETIKAKKKWRWFHTAVEAVLTPFARWQLQQQAKQWRKQQSLEKALQVSERMNERQA